MEKSRSYDQFYKPKIFASLEEWEHYAIHVRKMLMISLALIPEPFRSPLHPYIFGRWMGVGYTCEKVFFESLPGFYVTGNLFRPAVLKSRMPVILCPHGHWEDGRLQDRDSQVSVIARCITLARMGALVFSPDMVGYNDSCQLPHDQFPSDPAYGLSLMAVQTWNNIRSLDFLLSLPGADPDHVGVTGASGGGTQTFILGAVDDRVTAIAPIVMVSCSMQGGCLCENAPLLRLTADNVDIARLFAPRPMLLGSCTGDWTKDTPTKEFPAIRDIYELYGSADKLMNFHVDDSHNYNVAMREHVYGFFNKFLFRNHSSDAIPETAIPRPPYRDRMVFWGREAPAVLTGENFLNMWRRRMEEILRPYLSSTRKIQAELVPILPYILGDLPEPRPANYRSLGYIKVLREGNIMNISVNPAILTSLIAENRFYDTYNLSPLAECVREVRVAIKSVGGAITLRGKGAGGLVCLAAAALEQDIIVDMEGFTPDNDAWSPFMATPNLLRIGGVTTILAAIDSRV